MPDTRLDAVGELIKAERNKRARELALKYRLLALRVRGDDGFGGEDEPDERAVAAILEALDTA